MARGHARIMSTIWNDPEFVSLTANAQRVYLLALSQANLNYAGVLPFTAKRWAGLARDTKPAQMQRALDELTAGRFVIYDDDTDELLVRSFVKNDGVLKSPNLCVAMVKDYNAVLSPIIRAAIIAELPNPLPEPFRKGFPEGFPEPFREEFAEGSSGPRELSPLPLLSSPHPPCPSPLTSPSPQSLPGRDPRVVAAVRELGRRDFDRAKATKGDRIRDDKSYLATCIEGRLIDSDALADLAERYPTFTPHALADQLEDLRAYGGVA